MKRRVIAIAVVLWRAAMMKKTQESTDLAVSVYWACRWGRRFHLTGDVFHLWRDDGRFVHCKIRNGSYVPGSVSTEWNTSGEVILQRMDTEERDSPPWWPHPPLIDLREFEE